MMTREGTASRIPDTRRPKWLEEDVAAVHLQPSADALRHWTRPFRRVPAGTRYSEAQMKRAGI